MIDPKKSNITPPKTPGDVPGKVEPGSAQQPSPPPQEEIKKPEPPKLIEGPTVLAYPTISKQILSPADNQYFLYGNEIEQVFGVKDPLKEARMHGEKIDAGSTKEIYKVKLNGKSWVVKAYSPRSDIDPVLLELAARPILKRLFEGSNISTPIAYGFESSDKCPVIISECLDGFSAVGKGENFEGMTAKDAASLELVCNAPIIQAFNLDSFFIQRDQKGNILRISMLDLESLLYLSGVPDGPDSKMPVIFIQLSQEKNQNYPKVRSEFSKDWLRKIDNESFEKDLAHEINSQTGGWLSLTSSRLIVGFVTIASNQYYERVKVD